MSSSDDAGGLKELANISISSRNFVVGIPRSFVPSVMDSRLMFAMASSSVDDAAAPFVVSDINAMVTLLVAKSRLSAVLAFIQYRNHCV